MGENKKEQMNFITHHWADKVATQIIRHKRGADGEEKETFTLASGITPSGVVHIGNFRELITVDFVKRALEKRGKKVNFIFSWDDYDVFRKIPANLPEPKQELFHKELGKSISNIPDPYEEQNSYADHFKKKMENSISKVEVRPKFLYQNEKYRSGEYKEQVKLALQKTETIKKILNEFRSTPLNENWYPVTIFCSTCGYNDNQISNYDGADEVTYFCHACNKEFTLNLQHDFNLKLLWRIDWPMRWKYEQVDFEPGGKDHSSDGGSYTTALRISREVFGYEPPIYLRYDFVLTKGTGSKLSSSSGNVITLDDLLKIYEPEIVRFIFASYKNNVDFSIAFDLDVIKTYDEFDRMKRQYSGIEEVSPKKLDKIKFIHYLSSVKGSLNHLDKAASPSSNQGISFRHLANICQINNFSIDKINFFLNKKSKITPLEFEIIKNRIGCIKEWITHYAPEDFKFLINETPKGKSLGTSLEVFPSEAYKEAIKNLRNSLKLNQELEDDKKLSDFLYVLIEEHHLDNKIFFKILYKLLIGKDKGPKLAGLINCIEKEKLINLLDLD